MSDPDPVYLAVYTGDQTHSRWDHAERWLVVVIPADEADELLGHFR
jgi:hypothetical protein